MPPKRHIVPPPGPAQAIPQTTELPAIKVARAAALHGADALPSADDHAAWQQAHDALQAAFEEGNAGLDQTRDTRQKALLNSLLETLSDELTALDQEDMQSRTISLQAASQQLGAGIESLKSLQQKIAKISDTIANAAAVIKAISGAISGLESFLATISAL